MTSAQVVETSVTNNSSFQNYTNPDDHTIRTTDTPGFKPFTILVRSLAVISIKTVVRHLNIMFRRHLDTIIKCRYTFSLSYILAETAIDKALGTRLLCSLQIQFLFICPFTRTNKHKKAVIKNKIVFTVMQQKNKSETIQWKKLRNSDVIEEKEIRHLFKF